MKKTIGKYLLHPYPFYYEGKSLKIIISLFFSMTFLFNYSFEPFNVEYSEHKMSFFWISVIHSVTPVFVLIAICLFGKWFKLEHKWNIEKEVVLIFFFFLMIGFIQFLIRDLVYNNQNNWSFHYLYEEIRNTFLVGTLFITILIPYNFNRLHKKHSHTATTLNNDISESLPSNNLIQTSISIDDLEFEIEQLMFAKSEGNYLELFLNNPNKKKALLRSTLKNFERQLTEYPNIIKTHRSYLVNSSYIKKIDGNAQGYQLHVHEYIVPVSRNMIANFNKKMKT